MIVRSNEIVGRWIEYATWKNSPILKDLWLLSDFIGGRKVDVLHIIEKFDQSKEDVKTLRRELGI